MMTVTGSYTMELACDGCNAAVAYYQGKSASDCHRQRRAAGWHVVGVANDQRKAFCPACCKAKGIRLPSS